MRHLRDDDIDAFAALHADPRMMRFLAAPLSRAESEATLARVRARAAELGFGPWAIQLPGQSLLIGLVGLNRPQFEAPFTPCVEIAWRISPERWGQGFATEAARAALDHGFHALGLPEILAWTTPANRASRRVMEKLGMIHHPTDDFEHPRLPEGHPLRRHVLYRTTRSAFSVGPETPPGGTGCR